MSAKVREIEDISTERLDVAPVRIEKGHLSKQDKDRIAQAADRSLQKLEVPGFKDSFPSSITSLPPLAQTVEQVPAVKKIVSPQVPANLFSLSAQESFSETCPQAVLTEIFQVVEKSTAESIKWTTELLHVDRKKQEELIGQEWVALQEQVEELKAKKDWESIKAILEYVSYAAMFVTAGSMGPGDAQTLLYAGAALGLINRLGEDTGISRKLLGLFITSKETKERILTSLSFLAAAVGIAGAIVTWQTRAFVSPTSEEVLKKVEQLTGITGTAAAFVQLLATWHQRKMFNARARLKEISADRSLLAFRQQKDMQKGRLMMDTLKDARRATQNAIANMAIDLES